MSDPIRNARERCNKNAAQLKLVEEAQGRDPDNENLRKLAHFLALRQAELDRTLADLIHWRMKETSGEPSPRPNSGRANIYE